MAHHIECLCVLSSQWGEPSSLCPDRDLLHFNVAGSEDVTKRCRLVQLDRFAEFNLSQYVFKRADLICLLTNLLTFLRSAPWNTFFAK